MSPTTVRLKSKKEQRVDQALAAHDHPSTESFVAERRPASWPNIVFEIRQLTGIAVTEATLRRWFPTIQ